MGDVATNVDRLLHLAETVCDASASDSDYVELDAILRADPTSRRRYWDYCRMHVTLEMELQACDSLQKVRERGNLDSTELAPWEADTLMALKPVVAPGSSSPAPTFPATIWHGTGGYLSSGWPLAYLIATVVVTVGALVAHMTPKSEFVQVARHSTPVHVRSLPQPEMQFVGQITGMAGCRWARGNAPLAMNDAVPVGREIKLESGLMEITYDTGAKVILQGPVTYQVESGSGGYLAVGKLTARVEKREERREGKGEGKTVERSGLSVHGSPKPRLLSYSSPRSSPSSSLFSVRTPTAVVTDLGTEFGVEVDKQGGTKSHVFRGSVYVQTLDANAKKEGSVIVLHDGEAVQIGMDRHDGANGIVMRRVGCDSKAFVRRMVRTPKTLDLLDVVAGGSGLGHLREHGIDPTSGMQDPVFVPGKLVGDGKYHPAPWRSNLIDGVFIPDGGSGPAVLDSAGHAFNSFPHTAGATLGSIWARSGKTKSAGKSPHAWVYDLGGGEQFMPDNRGLLCMHANAGITFNLEAMRKLHPSGRPGRFRAVAGVGKAKIATYTATFDHDMQGWTHADGPYWSSTGGQDGGGYAGGVRDAYCPYLRPPFDSVLCGDLAANFGSPVLSFSYYLKNFAGSPNDGGTLFMLAGGDRDGDEDTLWHWTPPDTSVPHEWRRYTWTVDTTADAAPAGWTRVRGSASWASSWSHVKELNFWTGGGSGPVNSGSGPVNNGIDTVVVSGVGLPTSGSGQLADVWVFVDGQLKLKRMQLRPSDGGVSIDVTIGADDRFLTLASTDGGDGNGLDWVVFGDPVVDWVSSEEDKR
jgi:hypothetical protein